MRVAVSAGENVLEHEEPTVAAWVNNYATRYSSMEDWLAAAEAQIAQAADEGARIFLFPELISEAWLGFAEKAQVLPSSKSWQAAQGVVFLNEMRRCAREYKLLIVAGSILHETDSGVWRNRSTILFPDGTEDYQDKLHLMPDEREIAGLGEGQGLRMIKFEGMNIAVIICLDIQIPRTAHMLMESGLQPDLILVPSMTVRRAGFNRVSTCAAARAIELHCPVVIVGGVGAYSYREALETNYSGAAVFIPCETVFGMDGDREMIGPFEHMEEEEGRLFIARQVPVFACQEARKNSLCEAWHLPNHLIPVEVITTESDFTKVKEVEIAA